MEPESSPQPWHAVLVELYEIIKAPGYRAIEEHVSQDSAAGPLSKSTVGYLLSGQANPRRASVEAFVLGCFHYARTHKPPIELPNGQDLLRHWMDRYDQAARPARGDGLSEGASAHARLPDLVPRELEATPDRSAGVVDRHWVVSARGTDLSATEFWFTGRQRALSQIAAFCEQRHPGLLIVTGMPGSGKSAVLGVLVLRSLAPHVLPTDVRTQVPNCGVAVAVYARGKDADTVLADVLRAQGHTVEDSIDVRDQLDGVLGEVNNAPLCVIDALDEAANQSDVAEAVRWLSSRVPVIVGVRPNGPTGPEGTVSLPASLQARHPRSLASTRRRTSTRETWLSTSRGVYVATGTVREGTGLLPGISTCSST